MCVHYVLLFILVMVLIVINILCLHCNEFIPIFSFLLFLGKCEAYILPVFTCLVSSLCIVMHLGMFGTTGLCVPLFFPSLCSGLDCCVVQMCKIPPATSVPNWIFCSSTLAKVQTQVWVLKRVLILVYFSLLIKLHFIKSALAMQCDSVQNVPLVIRVWPL